MDLEPPIVGPHKLWDVIKDHVFPAHEVVKGKEVFSLLQSVNCDIAEVSLAAIDLPFLEFKTFAI